MTMINEAGLISLFLIDTLFSDHRLNQEVFIEAGEEKRSRHYQRLLCELIADLVYRPGKEEGIDLSEEMLPSQIFNPFMSAFTKISKNKDLKNEKLLTLQIVKILTDTPDYIHERAERGEIEFDSSLLSSIALRHMVSIIQSDIDLFISYIKADIEINGKQEFIMKKRLSMGECELMKEIGKKDLCMMRQK